MRVTGKEVWQRSQRWSDRSHRHHLLYLDMIGSIEGKGYHESCLSVVCPMQGWWSQWGRGNIPAIEMVVALSLARVIAAQGWARDLPPLFYNTFFFATLCCLLRFCPIFSRRKDKLFMSLGVCPRLPIVARGCGFESDVSIVWGE